MPRAPCHAVCHARPYTDETTLDGARAFTSTAWVASHVMGMLGFIGLAIGLQFFGPPPVRMAHGVLLAVGCLWLAIGLWGRRLAEPRAVHNGQLPSLGVPAPRSAPY
jgi:hypothetical protein